MRKQRKQQKLPFKLSYYIKKAFENKHKEIIFLFIFVKKVCKLSFYLLIYIFLNVCISFCLKHSKIILK